MKRYMFGLLILVSIFNSNAGFAQSTAKHHKTARKTPCNTLTTAAPEYHHKYHSKGIVRHHIPKKHPIARLYETITIDDHSATAIVNIKDGNVYVNDSLVTTIKNPKNEDHRLIINYITPPPAPITIIEHEKVNVYTGQKAESMLGVYAGNDCSGGVFVDEVLPNSPADKAGLDHGDVITKINDHSIINGADLQATLSSYNAGDVVSVTFNDYGKTETKQVELIKKQDPSSCGCPNPHWGR